MSEGTSEGGPEFSTPAVEQGGGSGTSSESVPVSPAEASAPEESAAPPPEPEVAAKPEAGDRAAEPEAPAAVDPPEPAVAVEAPEEDIFDIPGWVSGSEPPQTPPEAIVTEIKPTPSKPEEVSAGAAKEQNNEEEKKPDHRIRNAAIATGVGVIAAAQVTTAYLAINNGSKPPAEGSAIQVEAPGVRESPAPSEVPEEGGGETVAPEGCEPEGVVEKPGDFKTLEDVVRHKIDKDGLTRRDANPAPHDGDATPQEVKDAVNCTDAANDKVDKYDWTVPANEPITVMVKRRPVPVPENPGAAPIHPSEGVLPSTD